MDNLRCVCVCVFNDVKLNYQLKSKTILVRKGKYWNKCKTLAQLQLIDLLHSSPLCCKKCCGSCSLYRTKFLKKPPDDSEPEEAIEYHHHTHEVMFQSLRFENSQSGFVMFTNQSENTEEINSEGINTGQTLYQSVLWHVIVIEFIIVVQTLIYHHNVTSKWIGCLQ